MNIIQKRDAIKRIMDSIFDVETKVKDLDIMSCDEHDSIIFSATVFDSSCALVFRFDRNADGTYAVNEAD